MAMKNKIVILGLGSNFEDRLHHLRSAFVAIKKISGLVVKLISPIYLSDALLPQHAPKEWDRPYLNLAIRCETTLDPLDLLKQLKNIESSLGREFKYHHWGPRCIDIDILVWENCTIQSEILTLPHPDLMERPFALWPLADIAPLWKFHDKTAAELVDKWGSRFNGEAPFHTKQINQRIDMPQLVGIVNITPDSFSDGGQFLHPHEVFAHMHKLIYAGAEIIDLGAESTAPYAKPLDAKTEWERLQPVLVEIKNKKNEFFIQPKISIDTRHSLVAEKALEWGVDLINDVSGLDDEAMRNVILKSKTDCIIMHHLSIPANRQSVLPRGEDSINLVYEWAERRLQALERMGIERTRIIFDPGIGFGKMAEQSLLLIKNMKAFSHLGVRMLVGHSRKSFLSLFSHAPFAERDAETMIIALSLAKQSVDYIRVHNVALCAQGFKVMAALTPETV